MIQDPLFFLSHQEYGTYCRPLAVKLGLAVACVLAELVEKRHYHLLRDELYSDPQRGEGFFYHTVDAMEARIGLSRREQETALSKLQDLGLIEMRVFGVPPRRHFRLNEDKILAIFNLRTEKKLKKSKTDLLIQDSALNTDKSAELIRRKTPNPYKEEEPKEKNPKRNTPPSPVGEVGIAADAAGGERDSSASIGREKPEKPRGSTPPPERKHPPAEEIQTFGEEGLVHLTSKQYASLLKHMTAEERDEWIIDLELEIAKRGPEAFAKRYKSHYHTILSWRRYRDRGGGGGSKQIVTAFSSGSKLPDRRLRSPYLTPGDLKEDNFKRERL